jgi:heme/copper-type cytochrome/quinol oxidase subunit 4
MMWIGIGAVAVAVAVVAGIRWLLRDVARNMDHSRGE